MNKIYKFLLLLSVLPFAKNSIAQGNNTYVKDTNRYQKIFYKNDGVNPVIREQMSDDEFNPKPIPNTNHKQTEPNPNGKDYIEMWKITSARTTAVGSIESFYMLSPDSYFKFFELNEVKVKLNANFPEQIGKFYQSPLSIKIVFDNNSNCSNCINSLEIRRKSEAETTFELLFDNSSQYFTTETLH